MDKKKIIDLIVAKLEEDLKILRAAAQAAYEAATDEEARPENEYDTRALEASYLAGAQARRVMDIEEQLTLYKYLEVKNFKADAAVGPTALVEISLNSKKSFVFIAPKGGGINISLDGKSIQILSPSSPLGEALVGLRVGDEAIVENSEHTKEYEILSIQ